VTAADDRRLTRSTKVGSVPLVLTGDLNMGPQRASDLTGMRPLASGPTFPAEEPTEQLDHILADHPALQSRHEEVVHLPLSDHRALVTDLA
jgi:endonuclease/exonuclease/phosphatase family metal-dependent hydrolase